MKRLLGTICVLSSVIAAHTTEASNLTTCNWAGMKVVVFTNQNVSYKLVGSCLQKTDTSVANRSVIVTALWNPTTGIVDEEIGPHDWSVKGQGKCTGDPFTGGHGVSCQTVAMITPKFPSDEFVPLVPISTQILDGAVLQKLTALKAQAALNPVSATNPDPPKVTVAPAPAPIIVSPAAGQSVRNDQSFTLTLKSTSAQPATKFDFQIQRFTPQSKWVQVAVAPMNSLTPLLDVTKQPLGASIAVKQFEPSTKIRVRARNSGSPNALWSDWREVNITTLFNPAFALAPTIAMPLENQVVSGPLTIKVNAGADASNVELVFEAVTPQSGSFPQGVTPLPQYRETYQAGDADGFTFTAGTFKPGHYRVRARRPGTAHWSLWRSFQVK
ncbi:MAG TPA: hypothetical protein VE010_03570 [Thermoanaerobaculia bacterium]|nr:hypothetical protein [Thermoanaerobaculia bacterium]